MQNSSETNFEQFLEEEVAKRTFDKHLQQQTDFAQAAWSSANLAIRSLILVNGGAVVALLALMGSFQSSSWNRSATEAMVLPLLLFSIGVGLSILSASLAYFVNFLDFRKVVRSEISSKRPFIIVPRHDNKNARAACHVGAIIGVLTSIVLFWLGIWFMQDALTSSDIGPSGRESVYSAPV